MIKFIKSDDRLLLSYQPSGNFGSGNIGQRLDEEGVVTIRKVFTFERADRIEVTEPGEFDESRVLHDREVSTDTGWKIVLGRGLDIFQYISNDPFDMANRIQSLRKVKKFGISYISISSTRSVND